MRAHQTASIIDALASDAVALAITVDADEKIAMKKSNNPNKGGIQRPVYPWDTRANRVAGYVYEIGGIVHYTGDLVTPEGDSLHEGTLLESSLRLAHGLNRHGLLDDLVVFGEHSDTIREAERMGVQPLVISQDIVYELNPQTDEDWSSSGIIRRAQGESVKNSITRPAPGRYE